MIIQRQDPAIKTINPTLVKVGEAVHDAILDYHKHTPVFANNSSGACAVASYFLVEEAERRGINSQMCARWGHAFVMSEGLIYDPTVAQWLYSNGHLPSQYVKCGVYTLQELIDLGIGQWYKAGSSICHNDTASSLLYANTWGADQRPSSYHMLWLGYRATLIRR